MGDWKKDRLASALAGSNPTVLLRMKSGFAVFCDTQFLPGYCILLSALGEGLLNDLSMDKRVQFLRDMTMIGDAIAKTVNPLRINYAVMCNDLPMLHAHITPRYEWEPAERIRRPVQQYPNTYWSDPKYAWDRPEYAGIMKDLRKNLADIYRTCEEAQCLKDLKKL